ncbi:MAG: hypothetical protein E2O82_03635 [Betaproteobacteria bacterium]|nr:MAG: hypothetical protein E2O82_03635 [Betaproteobacteria bacterium]
MEVKNVVSKDTRIPLAMIGCCILGLISFYQVFVSPRLDSIQTLSIQVAVIEEKNAELKEKLRDLEHKQNGLGEDISKMVQSLANIEGQLKQMANAGRIRR